MSSMEERRLREAMAGDPRPTPFVGAGFSAAVTGSAECATWLGLLNNGIDRCKRAGMPDFTDEVAEALRTLLKGNNINGFITVADDISRRLRNQRGKIFGSWIDETIGSLRSKGDGPKLIGAVRNLGSTIFTTNYDKLIETPKPEWTSCTWTDPNYARAARRANSVVHLHGVVGDPRSIVLGSADYERLNGDKLNPILSKALFAEHIFIFIGCGSGLGDPHIGPLIEEMDKVTPDDDAEHYILVTNGEVDEYWSRQLPRIVPVGYGDSYRDLLSFLEDLVPGEKASGNGDSSGGTRQSVGWSGTGMLAHAKAAEQKLRDARSALNRVGDAMEDVQRSVPAPAMEDWSFEKQEAEHGQRAGALSGSAQRLEICSKEALGAFRAVEDQVSQLIEPRFADYASRLGRITKETTDLESDTARLLIRAAEARDEVGGRIGEYDGYRVIYETLSRAHAAIEQARGTATRLQAALTGLVSASEPGREDHARRTARSAEPEAPSPRQRDAARSEAAWRVPIAGSAAAGPGNMSADGEDDFLLIPPARNALKRNVLAVRVDGDSMTGDDMLDGDYVIIDKARREPRQGEIAVVRIGPSVHADMVVKHVWREEDGLLLKPSDTETHDSRKVLWNEEPSVEGMVIGVFRPASYRPLSN
jgi:SOS-response transcriptional repressor LexA